MLQRREAARPARPVDDLPENNSEAVPTVQRWLVWLLLAGLVLTATVISGNGWDVFRLPKQLAMTAVAILAAALVAAAALLGRFPLDDDARARLRLPLIVAACGIGWMLVSWAMSSNRPLGVNAFVWVISLAVVLFCGIVALRRVRVEWIAIAAFIPAAANAIVLALQASRIWNPWVFPAGTPEGLMRNGLLGNPDDAGIYLLVPSLLFAAFAFAAKRWRLLYAGAAIVSAIGLVLTATFTSLAALITGFFLILVRSSRRGAIVALLAVPVVIAATLMYAPFRHRVFGAIHDIGRGEGLRIISGRPAAFLAAIEMFRAHPIAGVGPGCFKYEYMPYRLLVEDKHADLVADSLLPRVNFGEAHNDHLQILAESGAPGYLALVAMFAIVAAISLRRSPRDDERASIAFVLALPLVGALAVAMMAQFPLQIAAPSYILTFCAAMCFAWRSAPGPRDA